MNAFYILILLLLSCNSLNHKIPDICTEVTDAEKIEQVSLKDVERIEQLNGFFVKIEGVLHYSFEDVALYPSMHADPKHAIWLNLVIPENIPNIDLEKLNGLSVTVIGKVNLSKKGHFGMYIATLDSAVCIKKTK
jgi:hypothetical protein